MPVASRGWQDQDAVAVDELGKDADRVVETALFAHIRAGEIVERVDLARVADTECHAEVAQLGVLAAGHEAAQRLQRVNRLASATHFADGQIIRVGAVDFRHMDEVQIRQITLIGDRAPGAGDRMQTRGDDAGGERLFERLAQERREQLVFLARGLVVPFAVA